MYRYIRQQYTSNNKVASVRYGVVILLVNIKTTFLLSLGKCCRKNRFFYYSDRRGGFGLATWLLVPTNDSPWDSYYSPMASSTCACRSDLSIISVEYVW